MFPSFLLLLHNSLVICEFEFSADEKQLDKAICLAQQVSQLLAAHGSGIAASLPHVNGLLESVGTALEAAAEDWMDGPTSKFEVKELFRADAKNPTQVKSFYPAKKDNHPRNKQALR